MFHACLQVLHVLRRKSFLIQFLHGSTSVGQQSGPLSCDIVNPALALSIDNRVLLYVSCRLPGGRRNGDKAISKKTRASNRKFTAERDFHVVVNTQWHRDTWTVGDEAWPAGDTTDSGASEQDIGTFQQTARVRETNSERIVRLHAFAKATELYD